MREADRAEPSPYSPCFFLADALLVGLTVRSIIRENKWFRLSDRDSSLSARNLLDLGQPVCA